MSAVKYITFDGKQCPIRFDVNGYCTFEEITGKSLINGFVYMDITSIRALYYVALRAGFKFEFGENFKKNIEEVGDLIDISDKESLKVLIRALHESLGFITNDKAEKSDQEKTEGAGE